MAEPRTGARLRNGYIGTMGSDGALQHRTEVFLGNIANDEALESAAVLTIPGECQIHNMIVAHNAAFGTTPKLQYRDHPTGASPGNWQDVDTIPVAVGQREVGHMADDRHLMGTTTPREFRLKFTGAGISGNTAAKTVVSIVFSNL